MSAPFFLRARLAIGLLVALQIARLLRTMIVLLTLLAVALPAVLVLLVHETSSLLPPRFRTTCPGGSGEVSPWALTWTHCVAANSASQSARRFS